nr:MAG TPA: hypothetical protein [Caudoviricetes sp.]
MSTFVLKCPSPLCDIVKSAKCIIKQCLVEVQKNFCRAFLMQ